MEYACGSWGSTYLVQHRGLGADMAARTITLYYLGITAGRFAAGLLSARWPGRRLVRVGQGIVLAAIVLLLAPLPTACAGLGLFLVGFGNGPVFPNLLHLTPQLFGSERSQSVMGLQMAASYAGILLSPALFGILAQNFGTRPVRPVPARLLRPDGRRYRLHAAAAQIADKNKKQSDPARDVPSGGIVFYLW